MAKEPGRGASKVEVAAYVADLAGDLARMAREHRLDMLGYLLDVARLEAQQTVEGGDAEADQRIN